MPASKYVKIKIRKHDPGVYERLGNRAFVTTNSST
jgi:hypothetical protein